MKEKLYKLRKNISQDGLLKNIMLVIGGSGLAQMVNLIFQPLITRIYGPEEYGVLTIFTSLLLIFRISTLRYEMAIPIAKDDEEALNIVGLSFLILMISTTVISAVLFLNQDLLSLLNAKSIIDFKFIIPIGVFFQGASYILIEWMYRKKRFDIVSSNTVLKSISGNLSKIIIGVLGFLRVGLLFGHVISMGTSLFPLINNFSNSSKGKLKKINFKNMFNAGRRYKDFPLYQMPSSLSLHIRNQLPVIFLGPMFGSDVVGYFGLTNQIIKIPMALVGQSVMSVFFAEVASLGKNRPEEIKSISVSLLRNLIILGSIPFLILFVFGPELFSFVFGDEWYEAGVYARILSIYVFSNFVFSPISRVYEVFNKQKQKMIIDFTSLLLLFIIFLLSSYFNFSKYTVLILYSIVLTLVYFFTYILSLNIINNEINQRN